MRITKLLFIDTGTYNDMVARPYRSNITAQSVKTFEELTSGGMNVNAAALSGFAGSVIKPATTPVGNISIPNGWDVRRMRFMMEIEVNAGNGSGLKQILTGYTDYDGVSNGGHVDPNMKLYINNSMTFRTVTEVGPMGTYTRCMLNDTSQILIPPTGFHNLGNPNVAVSMRPEDVMMSMMVNSLGDNDVNDLRQTFLGGLKKSARGNSVAPAYMSRMIQGLHAAQNETDPFTGEVKDMYAKARDNVRDPILSYDQTLSRFTMETAYQDNASVSYAELCRLFPETDHIAQITRLSRPEQQASMSRGSTEYWHVSTPEAVMATTLASAIPAIMMELMLTKITVMASNDTLDGQFHVRVEDVASFTEGVDLGPFVMRFIDRLKLEVLRDLCSNNSITFNIAMKANVIGDSLIKISFNCGPTVDFMMPSFCDALCTPVITAHQTDLRTIAHDIEALYGAGATMQAPTNMVHQQSTSSV
jgi:hypothetical protein